jgi:hypothetical protein
VIITFVIVFVCVSFRNISIYVPGVSIYVPGVSMFIRIYLSIDRSSGNGH